MKYCVPIQFYKFIYRNENFAVLNKLSLKFQITFTLIKKFISEDEKSSGFLEGYFEKYAVTHQFIFAALFPKYFCRVDEHRVKCKTEF